MLVGVRLGVICVVIGSSLMFLVFFVYVFYKEKFVHICFITTLSSVDQCSFFLVFQDSKLPLEACELGFKLSYF